MRNYPCLRSVRLPQLLAGILCSLGIMALAQAAAPAPTFKISAAFPSLAPLSQPLCLASPPGDTKRLFICEKTGLLKVIPDVTASSVSPSVFLDLPALLSSRSEVLSTQSEQGLLGIAFHPAYSTNGYFYIFYAVLPNGGKSPAEWRISRFKAQATNPNAADPASEFVIVTQQHPEGNHNGGDALWRGWILVRLAWGRRTAKRFAWERPAYRRGIFFRTDQDRRG